MMQFVPGDDEGQRAHRHFILISDAAAEPGVSCEAAQQSDACAAHVREFLRQFGEVALSKCGVSNVIILLETLDWRFVGARDTHSPVPENAFRVANVAE